MRVQILPAEEKKHINFWTAIISTSHARDISPYQDIIEGSPEFGIKRSLEWGSCLNNFFLVKKGTFGF